MDSHESDPVLDHLQLLALSDACFFFFLQLVAHLTFVAIDFHLPSLPFLRIISMMIMMMCRMCRECDTQMTEKSFAMRDFSAPTRLRLEVLSIFFFIRAAGKFSVLHCFH